MLNFVRTGLRIGSFAEIRSILGEMGLALRSWLLRKLKLKFYIIWAAETQSTRILLINTKDKLIAEKHGTMQRLIKAEKNQ